MQLLFFIILPIIFLGLGIFRFDFEAYASLGMSAPVPANFACEQALRGTWAGG